MINVPSKREWSVDQESDLFGDIVVSKNLDFDKKGYLKMARKAMALYSQANDSDFADPIAMASDGVKLYVVTAENFFIVTIDTGTITATKHTDMNAPQFSFASDIDFFQGLPHVSGVSSVGSYATGVFTSRITGLSSSFPHPMCGNGGLNTLLVADGNVVKQYDASYVLDTANELTLPKDYIVTRIIYRNSNFYLLTRNINGGTAKVIVWSGSGTLTSGTYGVSADWIYSGCEYGSYFALITSAGQLLSFNGAGFTELANFPVYYTDWPWTSSASNTSLVGNVASRGMEALGNVLFMNINGALNLEMGSPQGQYLETMPSGLWKYDKDIGLYHTAGVNYKNNLVLQPTDIGSGALVFPQAHGLLTGDPVLCAAQSGITGVTLRQTYYAIALTTTTAQLALSPAEALAGKYIAVGGTPNAGDLFAMDTYNSVGSGEVLNAGPVFIMKKLITDIFYSAQVLFASRAIDNALNGVGVLMGLGMGRNRGYLISAKISSSNITDTWQDIVAKYPNLSLASEAIYVKYRLTERFGTPTHPSFSGSAAFSGTNTFTVNPANKDIQTIEIGDEIEFITGAASGYLAHVTAIDSTTNPSLWTFTLDENMPVSNGDKTDFIAMNWTKFDARTVSSEDNVHNFAKLTIGNPGTWVQFKIALRGRELEFEQFQVINAANQEAK